MKKGQIETYEYCKKHLDCFKTWYEKLPFKYQKYGCGTGRPNIEYTLEEIHNKMHNAIAVAMSDAEKSINEIIDKI